MPRKPRLGDENMVIESLSTGLRVQQPIVDDFTQEPVVQTTVKPRHVPTHAEMLAKQQQRKYVQERQRIESATQVLRDAGLVESTTASATPAQIPTGYVKLGEHSMMRVHQRGWRRI